MDGLEVRAFRPRLLCQISSIKPIYIYNLYVYQIQLCHICGIIVIGSSSRIHITYNS